MSYGDELIASGHARAECARAGKRRAVIVDRRGERRWSDLWENLPWIVPADQSAGPDDIEVKNGPHCRPYIQYPFTRHGGCHYSGWRVRDNVGDFLMSHRELIYSSQIDAHVLLEPHITAEGNPNKQWGWDKWQELAHLLKGLPLAQVGPPGTRILDGVRHIETGSFRQAVCALHSTLSAVLPEGGLHHALGVLKKPAVVLFGSAVPPEMMGYPWHDNVARGSACGAWEPCSHCAAVWSDLDPEEIADRLRDQVEALTPRAVAGPSLLKPATAAPPLPPVGTPEHAAITRRNADYHRDVLKPFA